MAHYKPTQKELAYAYEASIVRIKNNPEIAGDYEKVINDLPHFNNETDAIRAAIKMNNAERLVCQVLAKVGKDEEYYFIKNYYIVALNNKVLQAADFIGMVQIFVL